MLEVDPGHADAVAALATATFAGAVASPVPDLTGRTRVIDVEVP